MKTLNKKVTIFKAKKITIFLLLFLIFIVFVLGGGYLINSIFNLSYLPLILIPIIGFYGFVYYIVLYYRIKNDSKSYILDKNKYSRIYEFVEKTSQKMNIKPPTVFLYEHDDTPNAFAFGITKNRAFIIINKALADYLTEEELKGVIAHELTHIKNNDVVTTFLTKFFCDTIHVILVMLTFFTGISLASKNEFVGNNIENAILRVLLFPYTISIILFFALMRTQEWLADYEGAKYSGLPKELSFALNKINNYYIDIIVNKNKYIEQSFYFVNPFSLKLKDVFKTHPDTEDRIEILEEVYREENF